MVINLSYATVISNNTKYDTYKVISFMTEYRKERKFLFTIHKTISTRAQIAGDNLPVLICIVSCVDDSQR